MHHLLVFLTPRRRPERGWDTRDAILAASGGAAVEALDTWGSHPLDWPEALVGADAVLPPAGHGCWLLTCEIQVWKGLTRKRLALTSWSWRPVAQVDALPFLVGRDLVVVDEPLPPPADAARPGRPELRLVLGERS
jgi:hypothetical protein